MFLVAAAALAARADEKPTYTIGTPKPATIRLTTDAASNEWLSSNAVYAASAGYTVATNVSEKTEIDGAQYSLAAAEVGFSWERSKPEYYLSDRIDAPSDVDWYATTELWNESQSRGEETGFLINQDNDNPCVYAVSGGNQVFSWVLKDGSTNTMTYVIAQSASGRPRRIFWTDEPYNAPAVSLSGMFVKFMGNDDLLSLKESVVTNIVGGISQVTSNKVVRGLYVDPTTHNLYAAGNLSGQCVMVYYDTGSYENILAVQVVEVRKPEVIAMRGVIGEALEPSGQGYSIEGLKPNITAGVGDSTDNRGDYLYRHSGSYSYSPKHDNVYPLRPTVGERWKAEIYWMETDAMGVQWPFELNQYENDWPDDGWEFVRGDIRENGAVDYGAKIYIPTDYSASLQSYQEPEGHALAVSGDNSFYTTGEGWSLLKLTADDNIWFFPVHSIFRSNTNYYTLAASRIHVGEELALRGGSRSGVVAGIKEVFSATSEVPGYLYKAASGTQYDVNLYHATTNATSYSSNISTDTEETLPSKLYAVSTADDDLEVWWYDRVQIDDMPYPVDIPVLPQVYRPVWPDPDEAPTIVIASQKGSANENIWQQRGAAFFDSDDAQMFLPDRRYFPSGSGTVMFWTRAAVYPTGDTDPAADSAIFALGGGKTLSLYQKDGKLVTAIGGYSLNGGSTGGTLSVDCPGVKEINDWTHIALTFSSTGTTLYTNGVAAASSDRRPLNIGGFLEDNTFGLDGSNSGRTPAVGRQIAECSFWSMVLDADAINARRYEHLTGSEANLTAYFAFERNRDLDVILESREIDVRQFYDRVSGLACAAYDVALTTPGSPAKGTGVIASDKTPNVYYQNDSSAEGFNPNEEHAFVTSGASGYITWALRTDLNTDSSSRPGVFVEYQKNGEAELQFFHVVLTNDTWSSLSASCLAGELIPGPAPFNLFDDPYLPEDTWDNGVGAKGPAYRDRKGQVWARAAGTLPYRKYYAMREGFYFPSLGSSQPAVGTAIPWLARLDRPAADVIDGVPAVWTWNVSWPENVYEMKIGETLTVAENNLPGVWSMKSLSVIYPDPEEVEDTVLLADPTTMVSEEFDYNNLAALGLSTDNNGGMTMRSGKYHFTDLPPHLSSRFYIDATNSKMCFIGERTTSSAGASVLYPNVLSDSERTLIRNVVPAEYQTTNNAAWAAWRTAVDALATEAVRPNTMKRVDTEIFTTYSPVDHYSLTAMGATNYVVMIENDATNKTMGVNSGDPIQMHLIKVIPEYYTGRIVTREDEVNLLSEQLSVLYTDPIGGEADDFVFEWRSASPNVNGTVPDEYDNPAIYAPKTLSVSNGATRIVIGGEGDTLANMVNKYFICRYRAASTNTPAYRTMGDRWSEWCAPPALAEGWVQRVLNNVTPFNQRMTDLYENAAETAISMLQIAGRPYQGDVALNQDSLTSAGLIELYETILNKAESMSILQTEATADVSKQLMLAAERLTDLYKVLGDEAYTDAKNSTIGIGSNYSSAGDNQPAIDFTSVSSALFCFDNQVPSLLDEELALLRGRTGESAPTTHTAPYYNRLLWNFTKGITAGEVAYAVNYNISGTQTTALSEEQAAALYPQGHGDAYGHYLSALTPWYRLIRNPNFSWALSQGEMTLADSTVNVDYYEEAKFAEAAAAVAKVAAETVDLTARKAWRDNGGSGAGYLDEDSTRAFGYGEWASRGGYGALVNWGVANSLLPIDSSLLSEDEFNAAFADGALERIDRGTVDELAEIVSRAKAIQRSLDHADAGLNPLGLSDNAIPFDLSRLGDEYGVNTHFEQIRDRAGTALANARKTLDRAEEYSNRLRLLQDSEESYVASVEKEEAAFTKELIGYYGTPYSDDIGPGKTYVQGYDGPDLVHYMWMDVSKFGLTDVEDTIAVAAVSYSGLASKTTLATLKDQMDSSLTTNSLAYSVSASGLVVKPSSITGSRVTIGSIQEKYSDFLMKYLAVKNAQRVYDSAVSACETEYEYAAWMTGVETIINTAKTALNIYKLANTWTKYSLNQSILSLDYASNLEEEVYNGIKNSIPKITGAGLTVNVDPQALATAAMTGPEIAASTSLATGKLIAQSTINTIDAVAESMELALSEAELVSSYYNTLKTYVDGLREKAGAVTSAFYDLREKIADLNTAVEEYNAEVAKGETCLAEREAARKLTVDKIAQDRYNDMFFRLQRNAALARYEASFDLAQRYAFLAAQAYDYETAQLSSDRNSGDAFKAKIIGSRSLGSFDSDGGVMVGEEGDTGLSGLLAQMDANWLVLKPRLGINNPQTYTTWFSLRGECFRILDGEEGDAAWAQELTKYWVDDITADAEFERYCQPFQSQFGLKDKEPGLIIPFETTIDFAKNFFAKDLAGGDHAYDSTYYATKIASAGLWFDGYNAKAKGYTGKELLSATPVAYLVPVGFDMMRVPGLDEGSELAFKVVDQTIAAPYEIGSTELDDETWYPTASDGDLAGADETTRIRRHPSFRAYYDEEGGEPKDDNLDATRLVGRSVWNTRWLLVIPAGGMNADREKALSVFINGSDVDRDGKLDLKPVSDIRIGFRTYSTSGN